MTFLKAVMRLSLALICIIIFAWHSQAYPQKEISIVKSQDMAVETLRRYLQLRLRNADWKDYSKFITWPDEPSWDCNWVVSSYDLGRSKKRKQNVVVSVEYYRIGLFCYDFDFKANFKKVTINYELVKHPSGWKVNAPIPDYPEISADMLIRALRSSAENVNETSDRRAQAEAIAHKVADALNRARAGK